MDREKMMEAARDSLIAKYGPPASKDDETELNVLTPAMADFAIQIRDEAVKAERKRIALLVREIPMMPIGLYGSYCERLANELEMAYEKERCEHLYGDKPDEIELQLLCVVMGENTVAVKVEHGDAPQGIYADGWYGKIFLCTRTFPEFRAFIDALEEEPPVPRIELSSRISEEVQTYRLHYVRQKGDSQCIENAQSVLMASEIDALSQLAGKPLPIWTPTKGEWKQIVRQQLSDGNPTGAGCDVWRYTRSSAQAVPGLKYWIQSLSQGEKS